MKPIKLTLFIIAIACVLLSCKKSGDGNRSDCEDANTTKVTFTNTGSYPLRVEIATTLTPKLSLLTLYSALTWLPVHQ